MAKDPSLHQQFISLSPFNCSCLLSLIINIYLITHQTNLKVKWVLYVWGRDVEQVFFITSNMFGYSFIGVIRIDFINFWWCLVIGSQNQFFSLELILGEVKNFYFLSESLLEKLPNINHFTPKLIITKLISIKSILFRINSIKVKPNPLSLVLCDFHFL